MSHLPPSHRLRILLAEDEPLIALAIARALEARGHEVLTAGSAQEAFGILDRHAVDAALVDVGMPGRGLSVARRLVDDPSFRGRLVLMTGGSVADTALQLGHSVTLLQKPFDYQDVVALVEQGVVQTAGSPSTMRREGSEGHLRGATADLRSERRSRGA